MSIGRTGIIVCLLLTAPTNARALGDSNLATDAFVWPAPKGHVYSNLYLPLGDTSSTSTELRQAAAGAWLGVDPKFTTTFSGHFMFTADHAFESSLVTTDGVVGTGENFFKIREANLQYRVNGWDLRIGQQVIPWGVSDGINPTDFLSATDQRVLTPVSEEKRLSQPSALATFTPDQGDSSFAVTGVVTVLPPRSNLLVAPTSVPSFVTVADYHSAQQNPEGALRLSYLGPGWDLDLIGFSGYDHAPFFREDSAFVDASGPHLTVSPVFEQILSVGSNFTMTKGMWIFRNELAYTQPQALTALSPLDDTRRFNEVFGAERALGDSFRLQVQSLATYFPSYHVPVDADPLARQIRTANGLIHGMTEQARTGVSVRVAFENSEITAFTAEITGVSYFSSDFEYLLRPTLSYKWNSGLKASLGIEAAEGPANSPLGSLKAFNSAFTDLRWIF